MTTVSSHGKPKLRAARGAFARAGRPGKKTTVGVWCLVFGFSQRRMLSVPVCVGLRLIPPLSLPVCVRVGLWLKMLFVRVRLRPSAADPILSIFRSRLESRSHQPLKT
jgi:hypothetical protein